MLTGQSPQTVTQAATIILALRLPRTALVLLTGAALGGSGAAYQGLFRNPLADPYLIGVASGAGLGAVLAMNIQWPCSFWGLMAVPSAAFIGALLTVFIVYMPGPDRKNCPNDQPDPGGCGFQFLRNRRDILPDAAFDG